MSMYTTGTVSVTNSSATVTGSGTSWLTNVSVGDIFKVASEWNLYTIAVVVSDTEITLSTEYAGETASGLSYQIVRDFTPTLELMELYPGDRDWTIHLTLQTIRKIDTLFGTSASPQFGGLILGTDDGHVEKLVFTQANPVSGTWYDTGITLATNEAFSIMLNILYEDSDNHSNDRSALVHIGGYNGGTCTPTYISRPNGTEITVRLDSNKIQVCQSVNSGSNSKLSAFISYQTQEEI